MNKKFAWFMNTVFPFKYVLYWIGQCLFADVSGCIWIVKTNSCLACQMIKEEFLHSEPRFLSFYEGLVLVLALAFSFSLPAWKRWKLKLSLSEGVQVCQALLPYVHSSIRVPMQPFFAPGCRQPSRNELNWIAYTPWQSPTCYVELGHSAQSNL